MAEAISGKVTVELDRHEVYDLLRAAHEDLGRYVAKYENAGETFRFMIDDQREKVKFWEGILARMNE